MTNVNFVQPGTFDREFKYKVSKGTVLEINTQEISSSKPLMVTGNRNGLLSLNGFFIYYSPFKDFTGEDEFYFITLEEGKQISTKITADVVSTFRPKAHILILLGEELIKNPVMAIYELIKNSYDADAKEVKVVFDKIESLNESRILITDSGTGIKEEVLENVWFEPGSDFRKPISNEGKRNIKRSPIFKRIPMGEKGVGRFAVHKLGHKIKLITRPKKILTDELDDVSQEELLNYELIVEIDWRIFSQSKYLDDVKINWTKNTNESSFYFKEGSGTFIEVSDLKEAWTRGMARQLKRQTISMLSPKNDSSKFKIALDFQNWWLNDFPETSEILAEAPYKLITLLDKEYQITFEYTFELKNNSRIGSRKIDGQSIDETIKKKYSRNIKGELIPYIKSSLVRKEMDTKSIDEYISDFIAQELPYDNLMIEFYSYDLDSISLKDTTTTPSLIKELLKDHSGIKVFKGDLRVYDYGDNGNDWLGLDLKRVQNKEWFSNNQNIGYIYLDAETSGVLIEKTNREGFIENAAFENFKIIVEFILNEFKAERLSDRSRWLRFNKKDNTSSFDNQLQGFRSLINASSFTNQEDKQKILNEASVIENRYETDKSTLLLPASVGMTASFAIHEIEKLVPRMLETVNSNPIDNNKIKLEVSELKDYTDGILSILKKGGVKPISPIESIKQAVNNYSLKLSIRNIVVTIEEDVSVESIKCEKRLLVMMLMNLIDNSIYWLDTIYQGEKLIHISIIKREFGASILVVDNGPGFKDSIQDIVRPFFSRREGGIGIGMYLVDTIMMQFGKLNIIYDKEELRESNVPEIYSGAAVELIFTK